MPERPAVSTGLPSRFKSQRSTARVVGFLFLLTNQLAWFAEFRVRGKLIDYDSIGRTLANVASHQLLFRSGLACELLIFACDVVIIVGSYVILQGTGEMIALLGLAFRLVETAIVAVMTLTNFAVLRLLSDTSYSKAAQPGYLPGMVDMAISGHDAANNVAFLFFGVGSAAFAYLWFKSRYIPRPLALWGVLGSILAGISTFTYALSPHFAATFEPACFIPIGTFELILGVWLMVRAVPIPTLGHAL